MSEQKQLRLQFIGNLKEQKNQVSIFLKSGIQLRGTIDDFDDTGILLRDSCKAQLIMQSAIATIEPRTQGQDRRRF